MEPGNKAREPGVTSIKACGTASILHGLTLFPDHTQSNCGCGLGTRLPLARNCGDKVNVLLESTLWRSNEPQSHILTDVAEKAEACHMLHSIRALREEHTTSSPQLMTPLYHTLAMLHCTLRETAKVSLGQTLMVGSCHGIQLWPPHTHSPTTPRPHMHTHSPHAHTPHSHRARSMHRRPCLCPVELTRRVLRLYSTYSMSWSSVTHRRLARPHPPLTPLTS